MSYYIKVKNKIFFNFLKKNIIILKKKYYNFEKKYYNFEKKY